MYDINFLSFIYISLCIAFVCVIYHCTLRQYLLSKWFWFGYDRFGKHQGTWKEYFYMPIWGCEKCTAGQLALWFYIFNFDYNLFNHIVFISISIYFTHILTYFYARANQ